MYFSVATMKLPGVLVLCLLLSMTATVSSAVAAEAVANSIFLVAARDLRDPNFKESVVLITQPQGSGPFGVIINRPLAHRVSALFPDNEALQGRDDVVYFGGPVGRQSLVFLARTRQAPPRGTRVLNDVYFTPDSAWFDSMLKRADPLQGVRVYAGYAGWAAGQLQNEIERGGWHVVPADADTIFDKDPATIWPELIQRATQRMTRKTDSLRTAAYP